MYICENCGDLVDEVPSHTHYDRVDGNWAMSGYTTEEECCSCGGNYVEAVECKICGEYINPNDGRICKECLKEEMTLENAVEYSRECGCGYEVVLPDFFEIYTQKEIEEILIKHILSTEHKEQRAIKDFCESDIGCFSDFIEKQNN